MGKIQSRVGVSLSSLYDVRGSIAGLEELRQTEVAVVHEIGATAFSERLGATIRRRAATFAQSATVGEVLDDLPATPYMIHSVQVMEDVGNRVGRLCVVARDPIGGREVPLWVWDETSVREMRIVDDGGAAGVERFLVPDANFVNYPVLMVGDGQPHTQIVNEIAMRGSTTAFGAGNVVLTLLVRISFAALGDLNSYGIPIPGW